MALTYKEAATVATDAAWQGRCRAALADVIRAQVRALANDAPNRFQLTQLSVRATTDDTVLESIYWQVAGNAVSVVNLATPVADTFTDAQLKAGVRNALDDLMRP